MNLWADGYDKLNGNIFLPSRLSEQDKKNPFSAPIKCSITYSH